MIFSVIICTHNPSFDIFQRLLNAVSKLNESGIEHEVIIVDNNSSPQLETNEFVKSFLEKEKGAKLIRETTPGLTAARVAGINTAKSEWLVFFDDDNEPSPDYLSAIISLIENFPETGCWGPGIISVEYVGDRISKWMETKKPVFQQRETSAIRTGGETQWEEWYPVGTGLVIRRDFAIQYMQAVENKIYSVSDRRGKSLSSGGDVQMVFCVIKSGYKVGVSPSLKMNHLITKEKASFGYILRVTYGTASSYIQAYNQVFPEALIMYEVPKNKKILGRIYSFSKIHFREYKYKRDFLLSLANVLGEFKAVIIDAKVKTPFTLRLFEKLISYK
ncbi:MAG: glycosyltransferase family 2 protein [Bacteroidetes bacterium]|nr:glycosyltransferase family 2 protein [Bacteroidota bacterium]